VAIREAAPARLANGLLHGIPRVGGAHSRRSGNRQHLTAPHPSVAGSTHRSDTESYDLDERYQGGPLDELVAVAWNDRWGCPLLRHSRRGKASARSCRCFTRAVAVPSRRQLKRSANNGAGTVLQRGDAQRHQVRRCLVVVSHTTRRRRSGYLSIDSRRVCPILRVPQAARHPAPAPYPSRLRRNG
jgi:hypothetical protein